MKLTLILAGILVGFFCGFVPGIHPNTAGAILQDAIGEGETTAIILIAVLGAYTAISFIPAIFLGIPEGETLMSALPGHRMLREGRAQEALYVVAVSICVCTLISLALAFIFMGEIANMFGAVRPYIGYILVFFSAILLFREETVKKIVFALTVFLLCGILGLIVFDSHMHEPLFPLFVGFFAIPALLSHKDSGEHGKKIVPQNYSLSFLPHVIVGIFLGAVADLLPGISSPSQLAVFGSIIERKISARNFLAQIAAIDASHTVFSIASASTAGIARVGAVAIASKAHAFSVENMAFFMGIFVSALGVGAIFLLKGGKLAENLFYSLKFEKIAKVLCAYLFLLAFLFDGIYGLVVMSIASLIGFLPIFWGISRTHVMGSIIVASIVRAFAG